jgi:kynureninase
LQNNLENPIWGWLGAQDPFITPRYKASPGVKKFMVGSPPSLSIAALEPALDIHLQAGMDKLRKKSIHQAAYLIYLAEQWLMPLGFELGSPKDPAFRGSHVALRHPEAYRIYQAMTQSPPPAIKVIPDFRPPDNIRMSVVPLYTSYNDIYLAMKRIREIVEENIYKQYSE